jgi:hypothetical protein
MKLHLNICVLLAVAAAFVSAASIAITLPSEGLIVYDENPSNGSKKGFYLFDPVTTDLTLTCPLQKRPHLERDSSRWAEVEGEHSDGTRNEVQARRDHREAA